MFMLARDENWGDYSMIVKGYLFSFGDYEKLEKLLNFTVVMVIQLYEYIKNH